MRGDCDVSCEASEARRCEGCRKRKQGDEAKVKAKRRGGRVKRGDLKREGLEREGRNREAARDGGKRGGEEGRKLGLRDGET